MRHMLSSAAAFCALAAVSVSPAAAKCTRLAFSVNDYGKDGPTRDAKQLLDKYIAQKMAEKGIKQYTVGKKDVSCELFLNFILFDEHTCKAEATVCWGDSAAPRSAQAGAAAPPAIAHAAPAAAHAGKSAARKAAPRIEKAAAPPVEAGSIPAPDAASGISGGEGISSAAPEAEAEAEAAANPAPEEPDGADPAAAGAAETAPGTGPVERFAAPAKIVIPDPIKITRGVPAPKAPPAAPAPGPAAQ